MNDEEIHLLKNYQHLMRSDERLVARWLLEDWGGQETILPKWLEKRTNTSFWDRSFTMREYGNPDAMARAICIRLLRNHKDKLSLRKLS